MPIYLPPYVPPPPVHEYPTGEYQIQGGWDSISTNYFDAIDRYNLSGEPYHPVYDVYGQLLARDAALKTDVGNINSSLESYLNQRAPDAQANIQAKLGKIKFANPATARRVGDQVRQRIAAETAWNPSALYTTLPAEDVNTPGPDSFQVTNAIVPYLQQAQTAQSQAQTLEGLQSALSSIVSSANSATNAAPSLGSLESIYARYGSAPFIQGIAAKYGDPGGLGASAPQPSLFHAGTKKGSGAVTRILE
jgi:hypothetical protein